jgi:hypothetical protein
MSSPAWPHRPDEFLEEWLARRRWTREKWYAQKSRGLTPEIFRPPGTNRITITPQADEQWEMRMRELSASEEGRLEEQRRRAQRVAAVKVALERHTHISSQRRATAVEPRNSASIAQTAQITRWRPQMK